MIYTLPTSNYLRRSLLVNNRRPLPSEPAPQANNQKIQQELRSLGASKFGLWKLASRYLPHVIHENEQIGGLVYGRNDQDGAVLLVATDRRVLYIDKKPLFLNEDEITYDVVSGVRFSRAGFGCTVVLHSRIKDYVVHTMNKKAARQFVAYIEENKLEAVP